MRVVLWVAVLAGAALSLHFSYGIATQSLVVGAREGRWVYGYLQPFKWITVAVFVVTLAGMLAVMRATASRFGEREWAWLLVWFLAAVGVEGLICWLAPFDFERIFASNGANAFYGVAERYNPATILGDFERARTYWAPHAQSNMPGKAVLLNTVTPTFVLLAAWLFARWMRTQNAVYAVFFGASIYVLVLFEPLGLAIGVFLLGLLIWGMSRTGMTPSTLAWQGALAVGAFGATYAVVFWRWGFNMAPVVGLLAGDAIQFNVNALRPYDIWVRQNLVDFLIAVGACQAVLMVASMVDGFLSGGSWRQRLTSPPFITAVSLVGVLLVTDLLGVNRGEVVRLWIFIACAMQLPAAYVCARLHRSFALLVVLAVTLLHDALGTAMIGFILPG